MENLEEDGMPLRTVPNIIAVWILNGISWLIAFSTNDVLVKFQILKEVIAIISLLLAIAFTSYKFYQGWRGWNPRKKNKP